MHGDSILQPRNTRKSTETIFRVLPRFLVVQGFVEQLEESATNGLENTISIGDRLVRPARRNSFFTKRLSLVSRSARTKNRGSRGTKANGK